MLPCRPSDRGEDWHSVTSHLSSSSFAWDTQSQGSRQSNASAASSQVCMQAVHIVLAALASISACPACPAGIRELKLACAACLTIIAWGAALCCVRHEQGLMQALNMLSAVCLGSGTPILYGRILRVECMLLLPLALPTVCGSEGQRYRCNLTLLPHIALASPLLHLLAVVGQRWVLCGQAQQARGACQEGGAPKCAADAGAGVAGEQRG